MIKSKLWVGEVDVWFRKGCDTAWLVGRKSGKEEEAWVERLLLGWSGYGQIKDFVEISLD